MTRIETSTLNPLYVQKIEKRIALMQAYLAGKEIELRNTEDIKAGWITIEIGASLEWNFSRYEYRIKIETCVPYRRYLLRFTLENKPYILVYNHNKSDLDKPETRENFIHWIDDDYISHSAASSFTHHHYSNPSSSS